MASLRRSTVKAHLKRLDHASTSNAKGKAWERFVAYLFTTIPGIKISATNPVHVLNWYELDVALWNDQLANGLKSLPEIIFIEAKNLKGPVGVTAVRAFDSKLDQQGLKFGILLASRGVTGDPSKRTAAHGVIAGAQTKGRRIIVITRADIERLGSARQLVKLIKQKICELVVTGVAIY